MVRRAEEIKVYLDPVLAAALNLAVGEVGVAGAHGVTLVYHCMMGWHFT
jgi:hypothetical protein